MEICLKCKMPWCQKILKDEKDTEDHLKKHPSSDYFSRDIGKWDVKTEEIAKELRTRCRFCLQFLGKDETESEHMKKHPISDFFEAVAIPKWG